MPGAHLYRGRWLVLSTALLLQACAFLGGSDEQTDPEPAGKAATYYFECDTGPAFVARIQQGNAWLFLEGAAVNLPRRQSASGAKYQSRDTLFWSKGNEALLEQAGEDRRQCRNNPARAVWEAAKLDGEDFRAVGNEPGWTLVMDSERILVKKDYGTRRYEFPLTEPIIDVEARVTRYQSAAGGHTLRLQLEGQHCLDTMSDEAYPTRVLLVIDDERLRGCGRPLH